MGQVLACCTVAKRDANDDTMKIPPQEIEQPCACGRVDNHVLPPYWCPHQFLTATGAPVS